MLDQGVVLTVTYSTWCPRSNNEALESWWHGISMNYANAINYTKATNVGESLGYIRHGCLPGNICQHATVRRSRSRLLTAKSHGTKHNLKSRRHKRRLALWRRRTKWSPGGEHLQDEKQESNLCSHGSNMEGGDFGVEDYRYRTC